ncbi:MAG TPA: hypothetical protein VEI02_00875, partial [Planctomycetota bacterium]|nr:hypothetical protein [Planctomycetota bacterium]
MAPDDLDDGVAETPRAGADAALKTRTPPRGPWVYRKMLSFPAAHVKNGAWVRLVAKDGRPLGHGFLNRRSEIAFRTLGGPEDRDAGAVFRRKLAAAHDLR